MLKLVSVSIIPVVISLIVANGILKKAPVFDLFIKGAKSGIETSFRILPSLVGLIVAISMLRASGFFDVAENLIAPISDKLNFPEELVPLALIRPISGSASLAVVRDILSRFGADSLIGRCASVMMGSTETTFYTLAVYFGAVGITNSRYTVKCALLADLTGIIASVIAVSLLMN